MIIKQENYYNWYCFCEQQHEIGDDGNDVIPLIHLARTSIKHNVFEYEVNKSGDARLGNDVNEDGEEGKEPTEWTSSCDKSYINKSFDEE